jgi:hypothetical protein
MTESKDVCKVVWENDPVNGWRARIIGECKSLDDVLEEQRPSKKRYLGKRILKE